VVPVSLVGPELAALALGGSNEVISLAIRVNRGGDRLGRDNASGGDAGTSYLVLGGLLVPRCWPGNTESDDAGQWRRGLDGVSSADEAGTRSTGLA